MKKAEIVSKDYNDPLTEHDAKDTFHFLDPPYAGYNGEKKFDEPAFRKRLEGMKGKFLLTYGVKGKLDTSGFNVKRIRQPRTIRVMRGVGGSKFLTHLLVSNYDLSQKGLEKVLKALGPDAEIDDVEAIIDEENGARTSVFVSRGAKADVPAAPRPVEAVFGLCVEREKAISARLTGDGVAWQFDLARDGAGSDARMSADELSVIAKSFSVHGDRHLRPLTVGRVAAFDHAPGTPIAGEVLAEVLVERGLTTQDTRELFLSKNERIVGVLRLEKATEGWLAHLEQDDLVPGALRIGAPMPPIGDPGMPATLVAVVPPELAFWKCSGEEARTKRDALIASGFLAKENIAIVEGAFARVVRKAFLYEPERRTTKGYEDLLRGVANTKLREVFSLVDRVKAAKGETIYFDACDVAAADMNRVVARAVEKIDGPFILGAVDAVETRAALSKVGRPFRFAPWSDGASEDLAKRVFVTSFGAAGGRWADAAKADMSTADLAEAGALPPAQESETGADCVRALVATGMSEAEAKKTCAKQTKAWTVPITDGRTLKLHKAADEHYTLCVVLAPEEEDAQKDIYSADEIRQAAHKFMERFQNVGFMHQKLINKRAAIVESYIAPVDFKLDGEKVVKGTWLLAHHVFDNELWKMIKSGEITGLSIGGSAVRTPTGKSDAAKKTVDYQGLKIAIDRPKGFKQDLTLPDGTKRTRVYQVDYGEIPGTLGGDGEGLDVFVGEGSKDATDVFWFVQRKQADDGGWKFDEYKLVVGEPTIDAARKVYTDHIPEKYIARIVKTTIDMVKALRGLEPAEVLKVLDSITRA